MIIDHLFHPFYLSKLCSKFIILFALASAFISAVSPACTKCNVTPIAACSSSCNCPLGLKQGQYCGAEIACVHDNVYECSPSGDTCEYCYRISCHDCGKLDCSISTTTPPPTCSPACVKPKSCVNAQCVCQSLNCPKGQTCDKNGICAVSQIPVITAPKPKCSDQKTQNIVEQACESISKAAGPISNISNSPLDALEFFGVCEAAVLTVTAIGLEANIADLAVFGGGQALCAAMSVAVVGTQLVGTICSNTWQKFCQI
ncbi:hypothetical protein F8M41_016456 [Gigaspora margarita]|uniref:Uncharacterized protein n=1 Tax=Gigaspora margarita TaxID=4874 RepID=A0A8H4APA1_GIGMA|nr:hypothetical protein F8M41_016456 [Gigaspora margarita]